MIQKIAVIGSGTMGNGIAHVFAQYGFEVVLVDISSKALEKALATINANFDRQIKKELIDFQAKTAALSRLTTSTNLAEAVRDAALVVEAATEDTNTKLNIFRELDKLCPPHTILASNTSSISITLIGSVTQRPEKVVGMHFMNPVPMMKLVEIIKGFMTDQSTLDLVNQLAERLDKTPVLSADFPGFIANRILMPMINEAIYTLHEGVAGVAQIDNVMKLGLSHPMGALQLADFIGLDVCLSIMKVLYEGFANPKYAPCPLLVNMVRAGRLGVKSGEGFYDWSKGTKDLIVSPKFI